MMCSFTATNINKIFSGCEAVMYITPRLMGTDTVPETSAILNQLTRLVAQEDFINFYFLRD